MLSMLAPSHPFALLDAAMSDAISLSHMPALTRLDAAQPRLRDEGARYALELAAPGVAPSDLAVEAVDGRLTIKGETKTAAHTHFCNVTIALPEDADADAASASSADGLITISLPKKASAAPVRIAVTTDAEMDEASDGSDDDDEAARPYQLSVVAAGLAPADVVIEASKNVLTATGATKRTGAKLARRFALPRDADAARATASCVDGILTITVPKRPAAVPKTLAVKTAAEQPPEPEAPPPTPAAAKEDEEEEGVMV